VRAVMIDISRDRVPTVDTVRALVDRLAGWKLNQLQLYTEHTYAYRGHEEVWREADPYTADDLGALDAHCRSRGVELVANQNTLGHFERWLRHDRYRPLAIAPDGFDWVFGIRRPPMTLDPAKPGSFELVSDLLEQLVGALGGDRLHVGLDEPWELDRSRHGEWSAWLGRLRALPALAHKELLVWGDVPAVHPELLGALPDGVTVCEWGYEDNHPFDERCARLAQAGVPFWVCPGTSSWLSIAGRVDNMIGNIRAASAAGAAHGAEGLLVTDWGDMGHHQQPPASDPGFAVAACVSWCAGANDQIDPVSLAALLDAHRYDDPAGETGAAVVALGRVNTMVVPRPPNMSAFALNVLLPQWPVGQALTSGLDPGDLDAVLGLLDDTDGALARARPRAHDGAWVLDEARAMAALLRLSATDAQLRLAGDGTLGSVSGTDRRQLAHQLDDVVAEHRRLWALRYRPGGMSDSVAWFDNLRSVYLSGAPDRAWFGPFG
ncbi:MAG TPA: family 20 glycosylhydrolase, partial [Acidimicrobiales bacterium]|nr:family 20 glycosylhydrolase [Acidimicrobiales bacterium]